MSEQHSRSRNVERQLDGEPDSVSKPAEAVLRTVAAIVEGALRLEDPQERQAWLAGEVAGEPSEVRDEVERWLEAEECSIRVLDQPEQLGLLLRSDFGDASTVEVGQHIGPYTVLELLGRGGMGEVWKARQEPPLERVVALKVVRPESTSEQMLRRFEAEQRAIAQTSHSHIAKVYDTGFTEGGHPYFAMEWVDGPNISEWCRKHRAPLAQRIELMIDVCGALQHAHQQGVLHRDLKPSNILVSSADAEAKPRVIDFGIAKLVSEFDFGADKRPGRDEVESDSERLTREDAVLGTPDYMSPEQAAGRPVDTRTDVYALGAVLYELVCGRPLELRDARGAAEQDQESRSGRFVPPRERMRELTATDGRGDSALSEASGALPYSRLPEEIDWITAKALADDPDDRYSTPAELAQDLRELLSGRPVAAAPPSRWYTARRFAARNKTTVMLAGTVVLSLVVGILGTTVMALRAAAARDEALREAANAGAVAGFLTGVLEAADPNLTTRRGDDRRALEVRVVDLLDAAASRLSDTALADPVRAALRHTLGTTYYNLSRFGEAEELLAAALEARTNLQGADHPSTLTTAHNLAAVYESQNRIDEAFGLLEPTYLARVASLGSEDPETLVSRSNLAELLLARGELEEAREHFVEVLAAFERVYGAEHERSIAARNNLGFVLRRLGESEAAERHFRAALEATRAALPENHPHRVEALNNLGAHLHGLATSTSDEEVSSSQLAEAEELFREALALSTTLLGTTHATTLNTRNNFAVVRMRLGDLGGAAGEFERSLRDHLEVLGEKHPRTLLTRNNLAQVLSRLGEHEESLAQYQVLIPLADEALPLHHPFRISFHGGRAKALAAAGELTSAQERLASFYAALAAELGDQDSKVVALRATLEGLENFAADPYRQ